MIPAAPCWPLLKWYPDLVNLLVDLPREIPLWQSLLCKPQSEIIIETSRPWTFTPRGYPVCPSRERLFSKDCAGNGHDGIELSSDVYQGKWSIFCSRCYQKIFFPLRATIPQISDFLVHLCQNKDLPVSKGIVLPWISSSPLRVLISPPCREIFMISKSLVKSCPPQEVRPPEWNVSLLCSFTELYKPPERLQIEILLLNIFF